MILKLEAQLFTFNSSQLKNEIQSFLPAKKITVNSATHRDTSKPWWCPLLTDWWNARCQAKTEMCSASLENKQECKNIFLLAQRQFDKKKTSGLKRHNIGIEDSKSCVRCFMVLISGKSLLILEFKKIGYWYSVGSCREWWVSKSQQE